MVRLRAVEEEEGEEEKKEEEEGDDDDDDEEEEEEYNRHIRFIGCLERGRVCQAVRRHVCADVICVSCVDGVPQCWRACPRRPTSSRGSTKVRQPGGDGDDDDDDDDDMRRRRRRRRRMMPTTMMMMYAANIDQRVPRGALSVTRTGKVMMC
jgi:hypothetical protein